MLTGLLPEWEAETGRATVWRVGADAKRLIEGAPTKAIVPSYIQRGHFADANVIKTGVRRSSVALLEFTMEAPFDRDVLTQVFEQHLQRHGVYRHWVRQLSPTSFEAKSIPAQQLKLDIDLSVTRNTDRQELKDYLINEVPDLQHWDSFCFATLQPDSAHDSSFQIIYVVDHFYIDGISLGIFVYELTKAYLSALAGTPARLPAVNDYLRYCEEEAEHSTTLSVEDESVRSWVEFFYRNNTQLPRFPLNLGVTSLVPSSSLMREAALSDSILLPLLKELAQEGVSASAAMHAMAAVLYQKFTGEALYSMLSPVSTRQDRGDIFSMGWYTRLIPVQISLAACQTFLDVAREAQKAITSGSQLRTTPIHRVVELLSGETSQANVVSPMLSYLDLSSFPGNNLMVEHDARIYGSVTHSKEVFLWLNRTPKGLDINTIYPGTEAARTSVNRYIEAFIVLAHFLAENGVTSRI